MIRRTLSLASGAVALGTIALIMPSAVATAAPVAPANSDTSVPALPIVKEQHKRPVQKNLLNPKPVCNAWEDSRVVIERAQKSFEPVGAVEMRNDTTATIPLTQTLARTHSFTAGISGDVGGQFASAVKATIAPTFAFTMSWNAGQVIGPYQVPAGKTARASYGFGVITFDGTHQFCKLDGTWSKPTRVNGRAPLASTVRVQLYSDPSDVLNARRAENVPTDQRQAR
ncbi:hypothetical protein KEM60_03107 [Austwickia sp. TVS 96-490-7B]|uniref:hypothetical protein n=1 Tax=Austwickia sp. TVS 96-490-7B TaxID=2830843 RepID=UPI001C59940B|nr:hypothetical protein [Austwickia sp. TVS 96-490-7B]MBW3086878.1 hypothetical protein [Austwickia sp. TVS 96-490-7B]